MDDAQLNARKEAKRLLGSVAAGQDPADAKTRAKQSVTVRVLSERYMTEHAYVCKKCNYIIGFGARHRP